MLSQRAILFYPLVLAALPAVFLYDQNTGEGITFGQFIAPFAVLVIATILLSLVLKLLIRNDVKAAAVASAMILFFFSYGHIRDLLWQNDVMIFGALIARHTYFLPIACVTALVVVALALLYRGNLRPMLQAVTMGALILLVWNAGRVGLYEAGQLGEGGFDPQSIASALPLVSNVKELPDIYFIIMDGYGRADVLAETHDFDNSEFIGSLTAKGFYVAPKSRSNYLTTSLTIPSVLNMRYLDDAATNRPIARNSAVLNFVKEIGYQYVHLDSGGWLTRRNQYADLEFLANNSLEILVNNYFAALAKTTMAAPVFSTVGFDVDSPFAGNIADRFNENMLNLQEIADIPGPTFTFNHNLPPHPPYVFDRDGNRLVGASYDFVGIPTWRQTDLYVDELIYLNKRLEETLDYILERSEVQPIIVIMADHGTRSTFSLVDPYHTPSDLRIHEGTAILHAFYLPDHCKSAPYPTITPVNSFRAIFDSCFGTDFGLLPDKTFWGSEIDQPLDVWRFDQ